MKCVKFHADRPSRVGVQKGQENRCQIVVTCFYVTTWRTRNTQISAPRYTDICISADICIHLFTCIVKQTKFIFSLFVSIKFPRKMFDKKKEINAPSSFSSLRSLTYSLHEMRGTGIKTSKPRGIKRITFRMLFFQSWSIPVIGIRFKFSSGRMYVIFGRPTTTKTADK